jgi:PadR family transcriptional regulator PadR
MEKGLLAGNTTMLILKLLENKDMYGYQMIEALSEKSGNVFNLKAGTLYPILHNLENEGIVSAYDDNADSARIRKYYHLSSKGRRLLLAKQQEWAAYSEAVEKVLRGGASYAAV